MNRRSFLYQTGVSSLMYSSGVAAWDRLLKPDITKLTILHTNDVHSRVEAFPKDGGRNAGLGGVSKRASLIEKIRTKEDNVLLLDAGDIFQGTPYFNFFNGELEMKLMSELKYDAATIGNHDFDGGIDELHRSLEHANFPLLISNYDFSNTIMHDRHKPYIIKVVDGVKIGIFGIGIKLSGLVPQSLYKETQYLDPIKSAQKMANHLKNDLKCSYVICLSHLGYKYESSKVSDVVLAENTSNIDVILGGHTHTFMKQADLRKNVNGNEVIINQAGWAGIMLGRIDVFFEKNRSGKCLTCKNTYIGR